MGKRAYTVQQGDSWERIAGRFYNDQRMFGELMRANGQIAGGKLRPGMTIYLPTKRSNPLVSNVQAALVGIPQNANYQLYNAPDASVAQYDPATRKFNVLPIGGAAAGQQQQQFNAGLLSNPALNASGTAATQQNQQFNAGLLSNPALRAGGTAQRAALNPPATGPFYQHRRGGTAPTLSNAPGALPANVAAGNRPGRTASTSPYSAVTPPTVQPTAAGRPQAQTSARAQVNPVDQQWIQKYYQQAVSQGMNPSDALQWAQLQQQQNGGTGYVSPYSPMPGGGPYATMSQRNGPITPTAGRTEAEQLAYGAPGSSASAPGIDFSGLKNLAQNVGGALASGFGGLIGMGSPQDILNRQAQDAARAAEAAQRAQTATQAPTAAANTSPQYPGAGGSPSAPGGAYNYAPPAGASSTSPPTGGSVVNTAIAPTVTANDAVLKFQAAYADPNAMKYLPATLDQATLGGVAAANNMTITQLTSIMATKFGYTQAANGSWSRIGVAGGLDPLQSPTNDAIDTALPNATWAEASSMTNVPLGYGGPTFNYYGYSPTGRRSGKKAQFGAPIIWSPNSGDNP